MANGFPFLARLEVLPEWEAAARRFLDLGGAVMVLGAPDTGKSTLCRYLVYRTYAAGRPVGLVDLDLGQSHLGPPAALGLGLFPPLAPGDDSLFPQGLYFIGQTSPVGAILEVAVGCRVLADQGALQGVQRLVVNTSGFVQGPGAGRLKKAQAELLQPSLILALQRDRELEPLLHGLGGRGTASEIFTPTPTLPPQGGGRKTAEEPDEETSLLQKPYQLDNAVGAGFPRPQAPDSAPGKGTALCASTGTGRLEASGWTILRLPVSSRVSRRDPETRRLYREARFRHYFQKAGEWRLPWSSFAWEGLPLGQGRPLPPARLRQFGQILGVRVLYGEGQGRRAVLLTTKPPPAAWAPELAGLPDWDRVHWLSWEALQLRLVGLLDGRHRTLALGLILPFPWDRQALALLTPLAPEAASLVRFVKLGKLRLNLKGQELPNV